MLKGLWNVIPASIGTLQQILPLIKEIIVNVIRIIAILPFLWSDAQVLIAKVDELYAMAYGWVEKIKNLLLIT